MAGIGAIGNCGAQSVYPTGSANQTGAKSGVGPQSVSASSSPLVALIIGPSEAGPEVTPAASSDGGPASNLSDLRQQIDQSIASALQDYSAGGSAASGSSSGPATSNTSSTPPGTPDILQTIADAISQTLQKNGVDPEQLGQRPGAHHHHHHHHHATRNGGASGPVAGSDASDPSSSLSSPSSSTAGETANSATDSVNVASPALDLLQQLLEANGGGTNAGQTAIQVASGGNGGLAQNPGFNNLLQLLASLPAGANVDTQV
jgi:hypothetical protein